MNQYPYTTSPFGNSGGTGFASASASSNPQAQNGRASAEYQQQGQQPSNFAASSLHAAGIGTSSMSSNAYQSSPYHASDHPTTGYPSNGYQQGYSVQNYAQSSTNTAPIQAPLASQQHWPTSQPTLPPMSTALSAVSTSAPPVRPIGRGITLHASKLIFKLEFVQQPQRARMCGFGDKDRRPITPPPCIRARVWDKLTNQEISAADIANTDFLVCQVDLWDADRRQETNVVRHSSSSPAMSISASSTVAYPPVHDRQQVMLYANGQPAYVAYGSQLFPNHMVQMVGQPTSGHTRNLIGNCVSSCMKLVDENGELGLWFVKQDLSVRTEGEFCLRASLCDIEDPVNPGQCTDRAAPIAARVFSDKFRVYSAKKFPGVIESTALSKAFAQQGVKIPIRKDGKPIANAADFDRDDDDNHINA